MDDVLLLRIYKGLAILWMFAAIIMSIAVGLNQHYYRDGLEFFLFMLYPYYAVGIIYMVIKIKYRSLESTKEKWMRDGVIKVAVTIAGERILLFFLFVFSFIPFFFFVMGAMRLLDIVLVRL